MPGKTPTSEITLWTDPARAPLAQQLVERLSSAIHVLGIGGPRHAAIEELAQKNQCKPHDDLRKLIVDHPASYVVLMSYQGVGVDEILMAVRQGAIVLTLEPLLAGLDVWQQSKARHAARISSDDATRSANVDPASTGWPENQILLLPSFRRTAGWTSAAEPIQVLGSAQSLNFTSLGPSSEASLFARLQDAWEVIAHFSGLPESIEASVSGNATTDLRKISGHLCAMARFADGGCAVLQVSDRAVVPVRSLAIIGAQGQLSMTPDSYALHALQGGLLDQLSPKPPQNYVDEIASQWKTAMAQRAAVDDAPYRHLTLDALACCMASVLSSQTGQPESPRKLLELHGIV